MMFHLMFCFFLNNRREYHHKYHILQKTLR